jgi:3'-phosphoadenosine 5'-phosphosulfate sulfotransferase (PAPS reductase)/FAD synthetase
MEEIPETLEEKQAWTLEQKVVHFYMLLDVFYHRLNGNVYIAFSGGKDSTVMKWLCDNWTRMVGYPKIQAVFNNTTNEHKEILDFVKSFGDEVHWIRPRMTFVQTLQKYGYPLVSKEQSMAISRYKNSKSESVKEYRLTGFRNGKKVGSVGVISKKWRFLIDAPFNVTDRCCDILKKEPVKRFEKETGLRPIVGGMAEESAVRKRQYEKNGMCTIWKEGKEQLNPLSIFTEKDIWDLIKIKEISICPIYYDQVIDGQVVTGEKRTGCAYCAFGCQFEDKDNNRFQRLQMREPKRHETFMTKLGYKEALEYININPYRNQP